MPIPKPKKGEKEKDFISRCMSFLDAENSALKQDARLAACGSTWRKAKGIKEQLTSTPMKGESKRDFIKRCTRRVLVSRESRECNPAVVFARCGDAWNESHGGFKQEKFIMKNIRKLVAAVASVMKPKKTEKFKLPQNTVHGIVVSEAFFSLDTALRNTVRSRFGVKAWMYDFSNKEVVFRRDEELPEDGEMVLHKIPYKIVKGEIEFTGAPTEVRRAVNYESEQLTTGDMLDLIDMEIEVRKALEEKKNE